MTLNDYRFVDTNNRRVQLEAYGDAAIQKYMQPLVHAWGHELAFQTFCENFNKIIAEALETGIISADDVKAKRRKKRKLRQVSEDELSAPNSGMAI